MRPNPHDRGALHEPGAEHAQGRERDRVATGRTEPEGLWARHGIAPGLRWGFVALTLVTRAAWRDVPSHFVVRTLDRACTPEVQRALAARLGTVSELESSHSPVLSMPEALTREIVGFAARARPQVGAS